MKHGMEQLGLCVDPPSPYRFVEAFKVYARMEEEIPGALRTWDGNPTSKLVRM